MKTHSSVIAVLLVITLLLTSCGLGKNQKGETPMGARDKFPIQSITATQEGEHGISLESQFSITLAEEAAKEEVEALLAIEPSVGAFTLTGQGKEWLLAPETPLEPNQVYAISTVDAVDPQYKASFAFQTEKSLLVSGVYPDDASTRIETSTAIEITLNAADVDISEHFSIEPSVSGTFQTVGYLATFIPDKNLEEDTSYLVTLKAGVSAANSTPLQEDNQFRFTTVSNKTTAVEFADDFSTTHLAGDEIWLPLAAYSFEKELLPENISMDVTLFAYPNIQDYAEAVKEQAAARYKPGKKEDQMISTQNMKEIASYTTPPLEKDYQQCLVLPEQLAEGQYLVQVTATIEGETHELQSVFAVTPYSVYFQLASNNMLAWVNDTKTAAPVDEAQVALEQVPNLATTPEKLFAGSGTTGADGLASIVGEQTGDFFVSITKDDTLLYFDVINHYFEQTKQVRLESSYYTSLYSDRERYRPTDTLQIWGLVLPRSEEHTMPETAFLSIESNGKELAPVNRVELGAQGSFSSKIAISALESGYYEIVLRDSEKNIYSTHYIRVEEYQTPVYQIEITADQEQYYIGDPITVSVQANYYDGTPVAGRTMAFHMDYFEGETKVTLGESGSGTLQGTITAPQEEKISWHPVLSYANVDNSSDLEGMYISAYKEITVLPTDVVSKVESDFAHGKITVKTAYLNTDALGEPEIGFRRNNAFDSLAGSPADVPITIKIFKTTVTKTERDQIYDAVNKKTITTYDYDSVDSLVETLESATSNGEITVETATYLNTAEEFYWEEVSYRGTKGTSVVAPREPVWPQYDAGPNYSFFSEHGSKVAAVGDKLSLGLNREGEVEKNEGRVFYSVYQENLLEVGTFGQEGKEWTMKAEHLPNIVFAGAYFDGRQVFPIYQQTVSYDYSDSILDLSVETNKETYKPGEEATVSLLLTDKQGNPVQGSLCISVVDETEFADAPQTVNLMADIYRDIYYPSIVQMVPIRASASMTEKLDMASQANMLTGGGDVSQASAAVHLRKNFSKSALFETVETNAEGEATASFTLPDTITAWRVTALAVTKEVQGGDKLSHAVTTQAFYINTGITPQYLEGDDVVISVDGIAKSPASGSVLGQSIEYTTEVKDSESKVIDTKKETKTAGNRLYVNLGKLTSGQYTVTIRGNHGTLQDAIEQTVYVVPKGLTVRQVESVSAQEWDWKSEPLRYPVEFIAYDRILKPYFDTLSALSLQYGERTEQQIAAYYANRTLHGLSADTVAPLPLEPQIFNEMRYASNGYRALPQGSHDVATTAKAVAVLPSGFYTQYLRDYFAAAASAPESNLDQHSFALLGLALLKEPVLLTIREELQKNTAYSVENKLYLAAGLAALGDYTSALEVYTSVEDKIKETEDGQGKYLDLGNPTKNNQATAAALLALSYLNHPMAAELATYLVYAAPDTGQQVPYALEQLAFVQNFKFPKGKEAGTVTYPAGLGEEKTVSLGQSDGQVSFLLNQQEYTKKAVSFTGDVEYLIRYRKHADKLDNDPLFAIEKVFVGNPKVGEINQIKITITPTEQTPAGYYLLEDMIPSGLRFVNQVAYNGGETNYIPYLVEENQQISGTFYYNPEKAELERAINQTADDTGDEDEMPLVPEIDSSANSDGTITCYYYTSGMLPGDFVVEGAAIISGAGQLVGTSNAETITIK